MVMHSSGTTSAPKGIVHSSNTLRYATEGICRRWELSGDDRCLVATEFGFVGGLVFGYLPVLLNGGTGVLMSRWEPEEALRLIEEHRCTYVLLMPTHAADTLLAAQATTRDLSSMRVLAAPGLTPERRLAMQEAFGIPPLADYGLSEVPGHAAHGLREPEAKMLTTEGRPYDGTEIRILDPDGAPLPPGEIGDVVVNGPSRFLFFLGNDELTRETLTSWGGYRTGDLGYLDEDGHLVYVGRSKDIIRRGGVTVVPAELESVLIRHPAVHEAAVVPLPDERLGERACAALILKAGERAPTLAELQEFLEREGVAKYMWPESIEVFDDFPRTPSLKPVKREIVGQIVARANDPALIVSPEMSSTQSRGTKREEILAAATERFGRDGYEDTKWADIAADVGVGPTALYHYFESKQHCLYVIMDQAIEGFRSRFEELTADGRRPAGAPHGRDRGLLRALRARHPAQPRAGRRAGPAVGPQRLAARGAGAAGRARAHA